MTPPDVKFKWKINQQIAYLLTLPIGDKILEVEIPGDDVPPQGALEDGALGWGSLDQENLEGEPLILNFQVI